MKSRRIHTPPSLVLRTKLTLPEIKGRIINRERLIALLRDNEQSDIVLINADAGYGKTTLVNQWIRETGYPYVFYALNHEDSNFDLFMNHLITGFEQYKPDFLKNTKELVRLSKEIRNNTSMVMSTLINEIQKNATTHMYVLLDDYHTITRSSIVHNAVQYLIEHMPLRLHIVITSRESPAFSPLTKWRSKQRVFEIEREDLIFTTDEVQELIRDTYELSLTNKELQRITQYTEGWITGIQLILQSSGLHRITIKDTLNGFLEANEPLFDYFAHEVLSYESPRIQEFLTQSSLLDTLTPEACDYILRRTDSHRLLHDLEHRHLFLSEIQGYEYVFHHLFRKYLYMRLKARKEYRKLHVRAGRYYQRKKLFDLSIKHFLLAEQHVHAGKAMLKSIREDTAGRISGGIDTTILSVYLDELPDHVLLQIPELLVIKGTLLRDAGMHTNALDMYTLAEHAARTRHDRTTCAHSLSEKALLNWLQGNHTKALSLLQKALRTCPADSKTMKLHVLNLLALVWQDLSDLARAKTYLRKSRKLAQELKITYDQIILTSNLATIYLQEGEIKRAYEICKPLIPQLEEHYYYKVGVIYANAARAALDYGDTVWAESCLLTGWKICSPFDDRVSSATLNHCFGLLYMYKGQWDSAYTHFTKARTAFSVLRWRRMESSVLRNIGTLFRLKGNLQASLKSIEQAELLLKKPIPQNTAHVAFLLADRALINVEKGEIARAQKTLARCSRESQRTHWHLGEMYSLLVKTLIALRRKRKMRTRTILQNLLVVTNTYGYHGILGLELRHQPDLIAFMQTIPDKNDYIEKHGIGPQKSLIHVKFFGGLRVEDQRYHAIRMEWPTEKTKSLFAFLVFHGTRQITRDQVLQGLWPDLDKKRSHENLRTTAYRMRQTLKNVHIPGTALDAIFTYQKGRYILMPNIAIESDVENFRRFMKVAEAGTGSLDIKHALEEVIEISRDPFLPDIYDEWVDNERLRLREKRLTALKKMIAIESQHKKEKACAEYCKQYLMIEPLAEEIVCTYMKCLKNLGRVSEIKRIYRNLEKTLEKELNINPAPETQRYYHSLIT
jgi:ATP/maltotriose-dependent transcriptional regulator MalT/DNA-binding SARP family transcriptional activator